MKYLNQNNMKKVVCLLLLFLPLSCLFGQQYKTTLSGKREYTLKLLDIEADLNISTTSGNEIIIQATSLPEAPDKAKGLRPLTKSGVDNTGIGLNMEIIDNVIAFTGGKSGENLKYDFKIPENVNFYINNPGYSRLYNINLTGISKEIEIVISSGNIRMENITGPVIARTDKGNIDIIFSKCSQEGPMSIISQTGDIDVTIPPQEKVTLKLSASDGDIYTDLELVEQKGNDFSSFGMYGYVTSPRSYRYTYQFDLPRVDKKIREFYLPDISRIEVDKDREILSFKEDIQSLESDELLEEISKNQNKSSDAQQYYAKALAFSHPLYFYDFFFYDYKGDLNGGGIEIAMKTGNGNIYVRKAK
ncbi:MAG: hypothetical protein AMS27_06390 [Bacteroides sp. SM23_62_1]|nr:MAG: hypothetical protein AMS27_06390 [Bacteroides sp. SM23_62_1]